MYKPEKLKLNKFVKVAIPKNSDFFARMSGNFPNIPDSAYSGDEPMVPEGRKTDILADMDAYDRLMQREEYAKAQKGQE